MARTRPNLMQATAILEFLLNQDINSERCDENFEKNLRVAREVTKNAAILFGVCAPGLTASVATTLLNLGLCQELSQRFVLEYCLKYKTQDLNLVYTSSLMQDDTVENHVFVQLGAARVPDALMLENHPDIDFMLDPKEPQPLREYLSNNRRSTFADPLLHCVGSTKKELAPLVEYCDNLNITHVIGVMSFFNVPGLIENAPVIKYNATLIAEKIKSRDELANDLPSHNYPIKRSKTF